MTKKKTNAYGHGFGKTILFGEHFVVYGLPGIVAALGHKGEVLVEQSPSGQYEMIDKSPKFPGVPQLTWEKSNKLIMGVLNHLNITTPLRITLQGDLPVPNSGIGSSAAHLVALARAVNNFFDLNLSDEEINRAAYEGEKAIHGTPSGIDNTAATYGGFFWFERQQKKDKKNIIEPMVITKPIEIVLIESGTPTYAKDVIFSVKDFKEKHPEQTEKIFKEYKDTAYQAKQALIDYNLVQLGSLMNKNHELLQEITVSCPELDNVVKLARDSGALGAKLTGAGRGGLAIALTPGKELQNRVSERLEKAGYTTLKTIIAQSPPPAPENLAAQP